jgi:hypothetical protein
MDRVFSPTYLYELPGYGQGFFDKERIRLFSSGFMQIGGIMCRTIIVGNATKVPLQDLGFSVW